MQVEMREKREAVVERALSSIGDLATLPETVAKITEVVEDPESSPQDLNAVVQGDPSLSAKILQVINSAFYGMPGQVADIDRAVVLLGMKAVKNIAVAASIGPVFHAEPVPGLFDAKALWRHSIAVAVASRRIYSLMGNRLGADEMFLAGLVHDIGLVVERQVFTKELAEVCRCCQAGEGTLLELEERVIGATHEDLGAGLAERWRFPPQLRAVAGAHHSPDEADEGVRPMLHILHAADLLCSESDYGLGLAVSTDETSHDCLRELKIDDAQRDNICDQIGIGIFEARSVLGL